MRKARQTVFVNELRRALQQRQNIVNILLVESVARFIDPIARDFFLRIRDVDKVKQLDLALVIALCVLASAERDHLVGHAVYRVLNSALACKERLLHIRFGSAVCGAALEQ